MLLQSHAFAWKSKIDLNYALHLQSLCGPAMSELGYASIGSQAERDSDHFQVMTKTRAQVWPEWDKYAQDEEP